MRSEVQAFNHIGKMTIGMLYRNQQCSYQVGDWLVPSPPAPQTGRTWGRLGSDPGGRRCWGCGHRAGQMGGHL